MVMVQISEAILKRIVIRSIIRKIAVMEYEPAGCLVARQTRRSIEPIVRSTSRWIEAGATLASRQTARSGPQDRRAGYDDQRL